jgi:LPXTG-motif cell wall-anchored protein
LATLTFNGETFTVGCENVFDIENVTKDTAFVVYYEATLNEGAVIGGTGNPNEVYLEFSNNPYGDGTGETEIDKVTVYTYKVIVNKTDSQGRALEGAGFTLYKKNLKGEYVALGAEQKGDSMTTFTWIGLDDGDYKLEESTVPAGYNKMADLLFSISAEHSEDAGEATLALLDGGLMGAGVVDTGAITKDIVNNTGTVLPETGAEGTFFLITASALLVMVAAVFMITRKKMSIYED